MSFEFGFNYDESMNIVALNRLNKSWLYIEIYVVKIFC